MDRDLRDRWIAALESGEYKKGSGLLRRTGLDGGPDTFCCLGVLCEIGGADPVSAAFVDGRVVDSVEQSELARLNDQSATFAPVVAKIRELFPDEAPADA